MTHLQDHRQFWRAHYDRCHELGLALIQKLYGIEQSIKAKSDDEKRQAREERAIPVLDELHAWALKSVDNVPPTSLTGKALHYLLEQWPKLIRYVENGRLPTDNNTIASSNLYSLIEFAKANGIEPYLYLPAPSF